MTAFERIYPLGTIKINGLYNKALKTIPTKIIKLTSYPMDFGKNLVVLDYQLFCDFRCINRVLAVITAVNIKNIT